MIFITLTIEEFAPGKVSVSTKAPPCDATPREVATAERIRDAFQQAMQSSPGLVIKAQDFVRIDPLP